MTNSHPTPKPPTANVTALGATLTNLSRSEDDRDCLEVFAELLDTNSEGLWPLMLNVIVEPVAGAQILVVGHVRPGMTLQLDKDLEAQVVRFWFPEAGSDG